MTDLGLLLLELPVKPRMDKMLLTATVLGCLNQVLTIVCCLSHPNPFVLPTEPGERKLAAALQATISHVTLVMFGGHCRLAEDEALVHVAELAPYDGDFASADNNNDDDDGDTDDKDSGND